MHKLDLKKKKEDIWQREFSSPIWFIYKRIKKKKKNLLATQIFVA